MRYLCTVRHIDETCDGEYIRPRTRAGRKLVRLFLRGTWDIIFREPRSRAEMGECRKTRRAGFCWDTSDFYAVAIRQQERFYEDAKKRRRLARHAEELQRLLRLATVRGAFVGTRESAARKRRNLLALGIPF